jgi:hypothetical protein
MSDSSIAEHRHLRQVHHLLLTAFLVIVAVGAAVRT